MPNISEFKILQSYSMEFKISEFFWGCLSNPTNAKKKIDIIKYSSKLQTQKRWNWINKQRTRPSRTRPREEQIERSIEHFCRNCQPPKKAEEVEPTNRTISRGAIEWIENPKPRWTGRAQLTTKHFYRGKYTAQ